MPISATEQPEDFFRTRRQLSGPQPEDFFRTRRQMNGSSAMLWEEKGGFPLMGPTPGDPDYEAPPDSGTSTTPTPEPGPMVTTEASAWYENPWVLGGLAIGGLLFVGYLAKRGAFSSIDPWDGINPWDSMNLKGLESDCGCGG